MTISLKVRMLTTILLTSCSILQAQSLKTLILNDEVSVDFPSLPVMKEVDNKEMYFYRTSDYAFMVGIAKKSFQEYSLKLPAGAEIHQATDSFLNEIIKGKIAHGNQVLLSIKTIKIGTYLGKEIAYLTGDAKNDSSKERFSVLLLIKNTLYTFDCWYLKGQLNGMEKDRFFKSILVKN